ncbi:hypothetical protein NUSPORA_01220 [Nucleospora cyclopteri]
MPLSLTAADQIFSFACSVGPIFLKNKPFLSDPVFVYYLRIAFVGVIILQLASYFYIRNQIKAINNQTKFKYKNQNGVTDEEIEMSTYDYDLEECNKAIRSLFFHSAIAVLVHWKFKGIQPVLIQTMGVLKPILFSGLFREYIYGQKLVRPWDKNMIYGSIVEEVVEIKDEKSKKRKKEE